ncbi:MAG: DUF6691 family protein [Chakrabartia sp.]
MKTGIAFIMGLIFGVGLLVSGMTSPDRVRGFLDIAGQWDPSLAFVMGGAVLTAMPLFRLSRARAKPIAGDAFDSPATMRIDPRLVGGAALFGMGWGLVGICPGPALVGFALNPSAIFVFVAAMVAGLTFSSRVLRKR